MGSWCNVLQVWSNESYGKCQVHLRLFLNIITQIGGIWNLGPILPFSSGAHDLNVLTSVHFLIGRSINTGRPINTGTDYRFKFLLVSKILFVRYLCEQFMGNLQTHRLLILRRRYCSKSESGGHINEVINQNSTTQ